MEWKTEAQLQKLSEKYPTRYLQAADGSWRCPPGEVYAEQLGLKYQVRTDEELQPIYRTHLRSFWRSRSATKAGRVKSR
ncbi:hypothetical protein [Chamaesiphon sp.]|uniref:hypothetical protein n=1 Tax=Chamaesiphon sp. TaxID=2814140 RepID=UPI0035943A8C